jgi:hypothetical protein
VSETDKDFNGWAIVEIMGHQKFAGYVHTQAVGGTAMVRVDVPEIDGHPGFTKLFGGSSIYCLPPVSQEVARSMALSLRKAPVDVYEFPDAVLQAMRQAEQPKLEQNAAKRGRPSADDFYDGVVPADDFYQDEAC